jgi:putative transposase
MPRRARIDAPGALHHIIARGIERGKIFHDDTDREDFVRRLGDLIEQTGARCYAWALIPNHFHLLLKTGATPIATLMRRLLSGYATWFNRRHRRSGHLFQNRYKSILCQEDIYLKELVRYIHLNPLRAGLVEDLKALDSYPYCGHGALLGNLDCKWQAVERVLSLFGRREFEARANYLMFVHKGKGQGRRPELVGGGLIRSAGGWTNVKMLRGAGIFQKSDERILGDDDFVQSALSEAQEALKLKSAIAALDININQLIEAVAKEQGLQKEELIGTSKLRRLVRARSLICYWAVRRLGLSMTEVSHKMAISLAAVSIAVQRGERFINQENLSFEKFLNVEM